MKELENEHPDFHEILFFWSYEIYQHCSLDSNEEQITDILHRFSVILGCNSLDVCPIQNVFE